MTTSTTTEGQIYRSVSARPRGAWAVRFATTVAVILTVVGAVTMAVGFVGASGAVDMDVARTTLLIGLGLIAAGAGTLLLVILRVTR